MPERYILSQCTQKKIGADVLSVGGTDACGAIASTACDAMRDAAWALLDEDGALTKYTQVAWTTQEHWFEVLNATLRVKKFKPTRLVCEVEEVKST